MPVVVFVPTLTLLASSTTSVVLLSDFPWLVSLWLLDAKTPTLIDNIVDPLARIARWEGLDLTLFVARCLYGY